MCTSQFSNKSEKDLLPKKIFTGSPQMLNHQGMNDWLPTKLFVFGIKFYIILWSTSSGVKWKSTLL